MSLNTHLLQSHLLSERISDPDVVDQDTFDPVNVDWTGSVGITVQCIQPGRPNQNVFVERFNKAYRDEMLDLYLFNSLEEVREITYWWMIGYNEERPHDSLADLTPVE